MSEAGAPLPNLRPDLTLHPGTHTPEGAPTWVLYDPARHRYFNIGRLEFELLRRWRPRPAEELVARVQHETGLTVSGQYLEKFLHFLGNQNLLQVQEAEGVKQLLRQAITQRRQSLGGWLVHRYLFFRIPLFRPDRFLERTEPLVRFLFSPLAGWILLICALLGIYLVSRQWENFLNTFPYFFSLPGILTFALSLFFAKIAHELGHAYTAKYYGLKVPTIGVAFIVLWPILYTDTTDAWKLTSHRQRLWIGAAGILTELGLAALATLAWSFLPDGPARSAVFMLATATWLLTLFINLNPFMRFDGYYLLSDLLGMSNLQERAFALARWRLREWIFAFGDPPPEYFPAPRRRLLLFYAYATWIYRFFLFLGIALLVYALFFKLAGIVLMVIELIFFIARPIYREFSYWLKRRMDMRWNKNVMISLLLLGTLIALVSIPWQSDIHVPAVYRATHHQRIYPPHPGRLAAIHVQTGQRVETGELLFELEDPDIEHQLEIARLERRVIELQLQRQSADRVFLEQVGVLRTRLAETLAKIDRYQAQRENLRIHAPFSGEILQLNGTLREGRWVNPGLLLALLVERTEYRLTAYVAEDDIGHLRTGDSAKFYPATLENPVLEAKIVEMDSANIQQLQTQDHYVASEYGGELAARRDGEALVPARATYRVRLVINGVFPRKMTQKVETGTAVLAVAERRNLLQRAWVLINAVLIRESGF